MEHLILKDEGIVQPKTIYGLLKNNFGRAYAALSYQCAYLRTHYPTQYMASVLNCSYENKDKLLNTIQSCNKLGIQLELPSFLEIEDECIAKPDKILLGTCIFKNLKKSNVFSKFKKYSNSSLEELLRALYLGKVDKGKVLTLAKSGLIDSFAKKSKINRTGLIELIPAIWLYFEEYDRKEEQHTRWLEAKRKREYQDLNGVLPGERKVSVRKETERLGVFDLNPFQLIQSNRYLESISQYETLGLCIDDFPTYYTDRSSMCIPILNLSEVSSRKKIKVAGVVTKFEEHTTRKKQIRATLVIEDESGIVNCNIFPGVYKDIRKKIENCTPIEAVVTVMKQEDEKIELSLTSYRVLNPIDSSLTKDILDIIDLEQELIKEKGKLRFKNLLLNWEN